MYSLPCGSVLYMALVLQTRSYSDVVVQGQVMSATTITRLVRGMSVMVKGRLHDGLQFCRIP